MLKFNGKKPFDLEEIVYNLNTSYVKVQLSSNFIPSNICFNLNTSYVKVQRSLLNSFSLLSMSI